MSNPRKAGTGKIRRKNDPNTATISLSDFMRIQNTIVPSNFDKIENDNRRAYDERIKKQSQARMRQWPDSIEMSKKNKLEARKEAFYRQEEEKRRIDEEEQKFQELEKQVVVDRANKMFFEGQDAVKSFHSKLLLADALKEREYQKEILLRKKEIEREIEEENLENLHKQIADYDKKEEDKRLEDQAKKNFRMNVVNQQLKDAKIKRIKEYQDRAIEGEVVKKRAREEVEEQKKREIEKQKNIDKMNREFVEANVELEKLKEKKRIKEQLEEKKIEEYAIKKQEMVDLRKRKEDEKFQEKQRQRQVLIDKQIEYLNNLKDKQDQILAKHIKEAEEKRNNELAEKLRKRNEFKVSYIILLILLIETN